MKILLTFLTIVMFSFGASADYNAKPLKELLKEPLKDVCHRFAYTAVLESNTFWEYVDEGNVENANYYRKLLAETATIYNAFCKK